jgi:hypothetical protein
MHLLCSSALSGRTFKSSALIDTEANGFAFVDSTLIRTLSPLLSLSCQRLPHRVDYPMIYNTALPVGN